MNNLEFQNTQLESRPFKIIRISEVSKLTTISKSHIYTLARSGKFPKPRKITTNTSVWIESEILTWMEEQLGIEAVGAK